MRMVIRSLAVTVTALAVAQAAVSTPTPKAWADALDLRKALAIRGAEGTVDASALSAAGVDPATFVVPKRTKEVNPLYPETARRARAQGLVRVECVITASGSVEGCVVSRSPHPDLGRAAADALRQWKFTPAEVNGVATAVIATFEMRLLLK